MTAYWDSSALIAALHEDSVRDRLKREGGVTRTHALAEVFSTLTGGRLGVRFDTDQVAAMVRHLASQLRVVELETEQCLAAFDEARVKGVRGGRVYDYLHASAAIHHSCTKVYTLNLSDFSGLFDDLDIEAP
jgi:predicted nucleic acid-binding protein